MQSTVRIARWRSVAVAALTLLASVSGCGVADPASLDPSAGAADIATPTAAPPAPAAAPEAARGASCGERHPGTSGSSGDVDRARHLHASSDTTGRSSLDTGRSPSTCRAAGSSTSAITSRATTAPIDLRPTRDVDTGHGAGASGPGDGSTDRRRHRRPPPFGGHRAGHRDGRRRDALRPLLRPSRRAGVHRTRRATRLGREGAAPARRRGRGRRPGRGRCHSHRPPGPCAPLRVTGRRRHREPAVAPCARRDDRPLGPGSSDAGSRVVPETTGSRPAPARHGARQPVDQRVGTGPSAV